MKGALLASIVSATAVCCFAVALFFARFHRETKDRLFALFALAFVFLGLNRIALVSPLVDDENRPYIFVLRLAAFGLIAFAIVDKNRSSRA
jgi:uncharacterized protein DUF5985